MLLAEQELPTPPEHLSSPPVFNITRSLVLCVCFADRCPFVPFSFGHCVFCPSSIYGFWLPPWYLQTLLFIRYVHDQNIGKSFGAGKPKSICRINRQITDGGEPYIYYKGTHQLCLCLCYSDLLMGLERALSFCDMSTITG